MRAHILTNFPESFESYFSASMMRIAREKDLLSLQMYRLIDFSSHPNQRTDDRPYGGGSGAVMTCQPIVSAIQHIEEKVGTSVPKICLSPRGKEIIQENIESDAQIYRDVDVIFLCGHYEGIDERIFLMYDFCIYSLGRYIVSSGEIATMVYIDAITRLFPGVLGNHESALEESFSRPLHRKKEYPQYTRPQSFAGHEVPEVLVCGNHEDIRTWRIHNCL